MAGKQGRKPGRRSGDDDRQEPEETGNGVETDHPADQQERPRRVPGLNGYDPGLWPDGWR
jgi:hypothetical protein